MTTIEKRCETSGALRCPKFRRVSVNCPSPSHRKHISPQSAGSSGMWRKNAEMSVALPGDKVAKAMSMFVEVQGARKVTRKQLDRLFGYLSLDHCNLVKRRNQFLSRACKATR